MSSVPSTDLITAATDELTMQCAHGYSGCSGVTSIGCQLGSRWVAELPSMSALRMAVTGRQNSYLYLASITAMIASSSATDTRARKRALSTTSMFLAIAIWRSSGCVERGPVSTQKRASSVCRAVRFVLFFSPSSLISFKSLAHCALFSEIGGFGRNCDGLVIANGVTFGEGDPTGMVVPPYTPGGVL